MLLLAPSRQDSPLERLKHACEPQRWRRPAALGMALAVSLLPARCSCRAGRAVGSGPQSHRVWHSM